MSSPPPFASDPGIPAELALERAQCCVCGVRERVQVACGYDYEYQSSRQLWTYWRCAGCALVYLDPRPATSELARIYPAHYYSFDEAKRSSGLVSFFRRRLEAGKARDFAALLGPGPRRVLDVGCGDGRFLQILREFGSTEWDLRGIDLDPGAIRRARAKGLDAEVARLEDYAAGAGFDLIVLFQTLEHVSAPDAMVAKIHALLKPGGAFVIETPDVAGWDERLFRGGLWGGYHIPRHWNLFTPDNLARLVRQAGFEVESRRALISTSFWINSLHNALLVRRSPPALLRFFHYQNPLLLACFVPLERLALLLGRRTSNQRLVARRAGLSG